MVCRLCSVFIRRIFHIARLVVLHLAFCIEGIALMSQVAIICVISHSIYSCTPVILDGTWKEDIVLHQHPAKLRAGHSIILQLLKHVVVDVNVCKTHSGHALNTLVVVVVVNGDLVSVRISGALADKSDLVMVVEMRPRDGDPGHATGDVNQTIIIIGKRAVVNPDISHG